ncbi:uncharacterized protein si:ch211-14c7.2 isoform X2 [Danio aesculapii]|uniref:uncharacterized protein si:ch211-14c7.2 isoform X2 n=1 Tax=Danio aesculapii TaxID=1142201 RepID=UPI0024BF63B9|nr:uncharacterized protein si:ch211-14c7.2 isoform X2 [Danio aesculapii]
MLFLPITASDINPPRRMLQQNNNNNCLDMTHRDLLNECRRTNVSFTSALEFGAIPLIKGLRAWAVSGGYSKARRKANIGPRVQGTCQQPHENRVGQRSWSAPVSSGYGHTLESASNAARTPGVRQGGLGALVTVATLKGTEAGGRQTQTRCLFLKAQGRGSYICAVGNRGAGMRLVSPRTHAVILEGTKEELRCSSRGQRASQDGTDEGGMFKAKPRAIRKWRKCSKTTGSVEKRAAAHGSGEISNQCIELEHGDQESAVISDTRSLNATPNHTITRCQEGTSANQKDVKDLVKVEEGQPVAPENCCSSAKACAKLDEQVEPGMSDYRFNNEFKIGSNCANGDAQEFSQCPNDHHNINSSTDYVPNLRSSVALESTLNTKLPTTNYNTEPDVDHPPSEIPVSFQKDQESRPDERLQERENLHSVETADLSALSDGTPDTKTTAVPEGCRTPVDVECSTTEKKRRPSVCSPQQLITEQLEVQQSDKSPSRGFTAPTTSNVTVTTIHSQPNPAPTTTAAIATAVPALGTSEGGAGGGDVLLVLNSELLSEPARVDHGDTVAADEGCSDVGEEDEFGAFMQAGAEQLWTDEFREVQQLAPGEDYNCEHTSSADANKSASWASDWTAVQSCQQSETTWVAFNQETVDQKIVPGEQWWPSTEKPKLPLSTLHNVSNVFLEAFPSENPSCEDPGYIPTLKQLLQGPAENSNTGERKEQSLLDGLQDLDRMIGVKYKRAESLSCKLLLQSLHLEESSSECVTVRLKSTARFSPNLPSSNQQLAANAKRRLSYDFNRNIMT